MPKLDAKQQADVKEKFGLVDEDKTGSLNIDELKLLLALLNINKTDKDMAAFMDRADSGKDATLTLDEFLNEYSKEPEKKENIDELRKAFKVFDVNNDGVLSKEEFEMIMMRKGKDHLNPTDFSALMKKMDTNGDGVVSVDEYINFVFDK